MVLDARKGGARLLVSCTGRREAHQPYGEIEAIDLGTLKRSILARTGEPEDLLFRPHGIYLDGDMLYVISHEKEPGYHPILVYRVRGDTLVFTELIHTPHMHSPNALTVVGNGTVYFVNDSGKRGSLSEKIFRLKRASVVRLQKDAHGIWVPKVVAERLGYPAGINHLGDTLFVGDAILHRVHMYHMGEEGLEPLGTLDGMKGNDNIRIHKGQILTPGHVKPLRFVRHAKKSSRPSPVSVFLADPLSDTHSVLFETDGSLISGGSTAIIHGNHLYICQVFDPFLLKVQLESR
jgi:hypothetical protein